MFLICINSADVFIASRCYINATASLKLSDSATVKNKLPNYSMI